MKYTSTISDYKQYTKLLFKIYVKTNFTMSQQLLGC